MLILLNIKKIYLGLLFIMTFWTKISVGVLLSEVICRTARKEN